MTGVALEKDCLKAIGTLLLVSPVYGMGWSDDEPPEFQIQLKELASDVSGNEVGGWGQVESPGHKYDGHAAIFSLRHAGNWNFTDKLGHYNVCIYQTLPEMWKDSVVKFQPSRLPPGYCTCGPAIIGNPTKG